MKFDVETGCVARIEHGIAPPMGQAITIPATAQMGARGADVIIYVCTSPFGFRGVPTTDRELKAIAAEVARRLQQETV